MTGFYWVDLFYYGAFNLTCFRMTTVGGKCSWGRFLLGHPLPSVRAMCRILCAQCGTLDWRAGGYIPCQQASQDGKAKRNSFNTTILQAWFFSGLSFFWHQGEHFKLMRKCNGLIYLDAFNVSLTLAGEPKEGVEKTKIQYCTRLVCMHRGLQTLTELVPACGPSGKRGQREFLLLLRLNTTVISPGEAMQLGKLEESVCSLYLLWLQSHCLAKFLIVVGPLSHPPLPPLGDGSVESWHWWDEVSCKQENQL